MPLGVGFSDQTPHLPKYLVVSILPHEIKVVAIAPLVRHDWLKWSLDKYMINTRRQGLGFRIRVRI